MSFSFSVTVDRDTDFQEALLEEWVKEESRTTDEAEDLFGAVQETIGWWLRGLGEQWASVAVAVSGHANPGHGPREGWARDCLTVSVTVLRYRGEE